MILLIFFILRCQVPCTLIFCKFAGYLGCGFSYFFFSSWRLIKLTGSITVQDLLKKFYMFLSLCCLCMKELKTWLRYLFLFSLNINVTKKTGSEWRTNEGWQLYTTLCHMILFARAVHKGSSLLDLLFMRYDMKSKVIPALSLEGNKTDITSFREPS